MMLRFLANNQSTDSNLLLPCLYLAVIILFLLPRLPPKVGGAIDADGRGEELEEVL